MFCAERLELECCTRPYELYTKKIGCGDRLSIGDFVNHVQAEEAHHIVRIFGDPNRQFSICQSLLMGGVCSFPSLGHWDESGRRWSRR